MEDLEDDDGLEELAELMAEPPGGFNHGRRNGDPLDGVYDEGQEDWVPLLVEDRGLVSTKRYPVDSQSTTDRHGTLYAYVKLRCRCGRCRLAMAEWKRNRRVV